MVQRPLHSHFDPLIAMTIEELIGAMDNLYSHETSGNYLCNFSPIFSLTPKIKLPSIIQGLDKFFKGGHQQHLLSFHKSIFHFIIYNSWNGFNFFQAFQSFCIVCSQNLLWLLLALIPLFTAFDVCSKRFANQKES